MIDVGHVLKPLCSTSQRSWAQMTSKASVTRGLRTMACLSSWYMVNNIYIYGEYIWSIIYVWFIIYGLMIINNNNLVGSWLTILKNMSSSMGRMTSHILWKIKNVPNHQPVMLTPSIKTRGLLTFLYRPMFLVGMGLGGVMLNFALTCTLSAHYVDHVA